MFFLGSEFQPSPASLDLIHFPFDPVWILKVEFLQRFIVVSFIFPSGNTLPSAAIKMFSSLLKLVVRPDVETMLSHNFQLGINNPYRQCISF